MKKKIKLTTLSDEEIMGFEEPYMETFTGRRIYYGNINPDDIHIMDIAHSLSQICRFTGHTNKFYSVAQHSVLVADHQPTLAEARAGLLHDATECYLNDLASPLKKYLYGCGYSDLEDDFHHAIDKRFNINGGMTPNIKKVDLQALFTEKRDVLNHNSDWGWGNGIELFEETIIPLSPEKAKALFLKRFTELFPEQEIT